MLRLHRQGWRRSGAGDETFIVHCGRHGGQGAGLWRRTGISHPSAASEPHAVILQTHPFSLPQHFKAGKYDVHWQLIAIDTAKGLIVCLANPSTGQTVKQLVSSGADIGDPVVTIDEGDFEVTVATFVSTFIVTLTHDGQVGEGGGPGEGDIEGRWEGTWPPRLTLTGRRHFVIEVFAARTQLVAVALQRATTSGPWRRFGIADACLGASDSKALAQFFSAVNAKAAQLIPA